MSLSKVIEIARLELGVTEFPAGSNCVKYWPDYTGIGPSMQGQPWCVCFLWWCFWKAGESTAFFGGGKTASCSILLRWYREQGLTVPAEDVQVGDIVILNFHGTQDTEHCGLVTEVNRRAVTRELMQIQTIEGNTSSSGSQSNGDSVCEKTRYPSQIVAVCRPQYKAEEPISKSDYEGRWSQAAIDIAKADGVLTGYPDGSFKPTNPVTREELAQFYTNLKERGLLK